MEKTELLVKIKEIFSQELSLYDDINSDFNLNRFLVARNYDLEATKQMLQKYFEFRKEINFDELDKNFDLQKIQKYQSLLRHELYCTDKYYNPVLISRPKPELLRQLMKDVSQEELENYLIGKSERNLHVLLPLCSQEKKDKVEGLVIIFDLKDCGITDLLSSDIQNYFKKFVKISQDFYPQLVLKIYIINASYFFSTFWNIIKYVLNETTQKKVEISSSSNQESLLDRIGADNLPEYLGGKNKMSLNTIQGFYKDEMQQSYIQKRLRLEDQTIEKRYYSKQQMQSYGKKEYWNQRYIEDKENFDWYQKYQDIKPYLEPYLRKYKNPRILVLGCGNSRVSEEIYNDGYQNITNVDYSDVCISQMKDLYADGYEKMVFLEMNATDLQFPEESFDIVFDKGTLDSVLCSEGSSQNAIKCVKSVDRVLAKKGIYFVVSYGIPDYRSQYFDTEYNWDMQIHKIAKPILDNQNGQVDQTEKQQQYNYHYVYVCEKIKQYYDVLFSDDIFLHFYDISQQIKFYKVMNFNESEDTLSQKLRTLLWIFVSNEKTSQLTFLSILIYKKNIVQPFFWLQNFFQHTFYYQSLFCRTQINLYSLNIVCANLINSPNFFYNF